MNNIRVRFTEVNQASNFLNFEPEDQTQKKLKENIISALKCRDINDALMVRQWGTMEYHKLPKRKELYLFYACILNQLVDSEGWEPAKAWNALTSADRTLWQLYVKLHIDKQYDNYTYQLLTLFFGVPYIREMVS